VGKLAAADRPPEGPVECLREDFDRRRPDGDYLAWMSYVAMKTDLVEDYLVRLDTMGMRESVEGRVPLLDPSLVEFGLSLSQDAKVGHFEQKALFRRSVTPLLPEFILARPKQGFCPPVTSWALSLIGRQRNGGRSRLVEEGIVSPSATAQLNRDRSTGASFATWALATLDAWCGNNL
jgi:asparagine synthase (glutamine-hydrolysing)